MGYNRKAMVAPAEIAGIAVEREVGELFQVVAPGARLFGWERVEFGLVAA